MHLTLSATPPTEPASPPHVPNLGGYEQLYGVMVMLQGDPSVLIISLLYFCAKLNSLGPLPCSSPCHVSSLPRPPGQSIPYDALKQADSQDTNKQIDVSIHKSEPHVFGQLGYRVASKLISRWWGSCLMLVFHADVIGRSPYSGLDQFFLDIVESLLDSHDLGG